MLKNSQASLNNFQYYAAEALAGWFAKLTESHVISESLQQTHISSVALKHFRLIN